MMHYQVTDTLALCDVRCEDGTLIERDVTCERCNAILATYR